MKILIIITLFLFISCQSTNSVSQTSYDNSYENTSSTHEIVSAEALSALKELGDSSQLLDPSHLGCSNLYSNYDTGTIDLTAIDASLNSLNYESSLIYTDTNSNVGLYLQSNNTPKHDLSLRENSLDNECLGLNNYSILDVTIENTTDYWKSDSVGISYYFTLPDNFDITYALNSGTNLDSFTLSTIQPKAVFQMGNSNENCIRGYYRDRTVSPNIGSFTIGQCSVTIWVNLDDGKNETFTSDLSNLKIENVSFSEPLSNYFVTSDLKDITNQLVGYVRYYFNGTFQILDLTHTAL